MNFIGAAWEQKQYLVDRIIRGSAHSIWDSLIVLSQQILSG